MPGIIGSLDRGLRILEMLETNPEPLGVTGIADVLGIDKSSAYRLVQTLQARGFVEQLTDKRYRLGTACIRLGSVAIDNVDLRSEAAPFLEALAHRTGKTAHLAILADGTAVLVDKIQGRSVIAISTHLGSEAPPHCTASGKAIFAFQPLELLHRLYRDREMTSYTANTITNMAELERNLFHVRSQGYAMDNQERYDGVICLAAPICDHRNQVIGSIGVSGAFSQMSGVHREEMRQAVVEESGRLCSRLGCEVL